MKNAVFADVLALLDSSVKIETVISRLSTDPSKRYDPPFSRSIGHGKRRAPGIRPLPYPTIALASGVIPSSTPGTISSSRPG